MKPEWSWLLTGPPRGNAWNLGLVAIFATIAWAEYIAPLDGDGRLMLGFACFCAGARIEMALEGER